MEVMPNERPGILAIHESKAVLAVRYYLYLRIYFLAGSLLGHKAASSMPLSNMSILVE